MMGGDTTRNM